MSLSLLVLLEIENVPTTATLERAALDMRLPAIEFQLAGRLQDRAGFVPLSLGGSASGYEIYVVHPNELAVDRVVMELAQYEDPLIFEFRGGSSSKENAAVLYSAAIMVEKLGASAFDTERGQFVEAAELLQAASVFLQSEP